MENLDRNRAATVLIVDDHVLVRDLTGAYLASSGNYTVATAGTLSDAVKAIHDCGTFDLVLLDLALPDSKGLEGLEEILAANGEGKVAIFSGVAMREIVSDAITRGASGFIPKDLPLKSLINAINFIMSGEIYFPAAYISDFGHPETPSIKAMTPREMTVLRGIRSGLMNKQIARDMGISEVTVKMHVRSICKKLDAKNRTHAAMIATSLSLE